MARISREFVKLETRLLNDYRFFEMSERGQLAYIKLLVIGRTFDNKITKRLPTLKALLRVNWSQDDIAMIISEIKVNFPNFKSNKYFHYFSGYEERLLRGKLKTPTSAVNYCEDEDKDEEITVHQFNSLYEKYPKKVGKKQALKHFKVSVKTKQDFESITTALNNYLGSKRYNDGFVQNASTWFNNWKDWVDDPDPICRLCAGKGFVTNERGYDSRCSCDSGKGWKKC